MSASKKTTKNPRPGSAVHFDNHDRVVIVTGGAQGIGRAIVEAFAASQATVVVADVLTPDATLPGSPVCDCDWQVCDTSNQEDCRRVVEYAASTYGGVDVLVNNAAIQPPESYVPVDAQDDAMYERMLGVNFSGYTFMAKHALRVMREQQSGVVVNIASEQGHRTTRGVSTYGPIKAANILQARQWAVEYARDGIRAVSVSPGAIRTPLVAASLEQQGGEAELANRHPLGRIGDPEEVAQVVLFVASGGASFMTATDIAVDGGLGGLGAFADPYSA